MDGSRFDDLTRTMATGMSRRRVVGGVAALLGGLGLSRSTQANTRVEICHNDQRITVAEPAVSAHLAHGDAVPAALGSPCIEVVPPGGGFTCEANGPSCGETCVGAGGAGDGRCGNSFLGCVPDGQVCIEFTACCSGTCGSPSAGLISRCGACVGQNAGPCSNNADCCGGLTCVGNDLGGICRAA